MKLTDSNADVEDILSSSQDFATSELQLLSSHLQVQNIASSDIASLKQHIRGKLLVLAEQIESCTNKEALQQLSKQVNFKSRSFHQCKNTHVPRRCCQ
jgi:methylase of polypeptide subunit release factors